MSREALADILAVTSLRRGRSDARDPKAIKPVEPELLFATLLKWLPHGSDAAPAPSALPAQLAGFHGLTPGASLACLQGDMQAYVGLLRQFSASHRGDVAALRADLASGADGAARQRAHAIAGVAGTLGANDLHAAATAVERALREGLSGAGLSPLFATMQREIDALDALLASLPVQPAPAQGAAPPMEQLLGQFAALLARDDASAGDLFERHRALLLATHGARAMQLGRQINAFDFPGALATLDQLLPDQQVALAST